MLRVSVSALSGNSCSSEREDGACDSCEAERAHGQVLGDLQGDSELSWEDSGEKEKGNGSKSHRKKGQNQAGLCKESFLAEGRKWKHWVTLSV